MKHEKKAQFAEANPDPPPMSMMGAITEAKGAVLAMTGLPVDTVAQCRKGDDGAWRISVDVIESPARMGDNDLLATYEVIIGADAELMSFDRLRRYHREDRDG